MVLACVAVVSELMSILNSIDCARLLCKLVDIVTSVSKGSSS